VGNAARVDPAAGYAVPPEIAQDFEREGRLMAASGMKEPDYKHGGKFKVVPPEEVARILKTISGSCTT
jgi:hypothetical protein